MLLWFLGCGQPKDTEELTPPPVDTGTSEAVGPTAHTASSPTRDTGPAATDTGRDTAVAGDTGTAGTGETGAASATGETGIQRTNTGDTGTVGSATGETGLPPATRDTGDTGMPSLEVFVETCTLALTSSALPVGLTTGNLIDAVADVNSSCDLGYGGGIDRFARIDIPPGQLARVDLVLPNGEGFLLEDCGSSCVSSRVSVGVLEWANPSADTVSVTLALEDGDMSVAPTLYEVELSLSPLPPPAQEACPDAQVAEPLRTGAHAVYVDLRGATADMDPGPGNCTTNSSGPDQLVAVELQPNEVLRAYAGWLADLYLVGDCADPAGSCLGAMDTQEPFGFLAELEHVNDGVAAERVYLVVDDPVEDYPQVEVAAVPLRLDVEVAPAGEPLPATCAEAAAAPPLSPGTTEVSLPPLGGWARVEIGAGERAVISGAGSSLWGSDTLWAYAYQDCSDTAPFPTGIIGGSGEYGIELLGDPVAPVERLLKVLPSYGQVTLGLTLETTPSGSVSEAPSDCAEALLAPPLTAAGTYEFRIDPSPTVAEDDQIDLSDCSSFRNLRDRVVPIEVPGETILEVSSPTLGIFLGLVDCVDPLTPCEETVRGSVNQPIATVEHINPEVDPVVVYLVLEDGESTETHRVEVAFESLLESDPLLPTADTCADAQPLADLSSGAYLETLRDSLDDLRIPPNGCMGGPTPYADRFVPVTIGDGETLQVTAAGDPNLALILLEDCADAHSCVDANRFTSTGPNRLLHLNESGVEEALYLAVDGGKELRDPDLALQVEISTLPGYPGVDTCAQAQGSAPLGAPGEWYGEIPPTAVGDFPPSYLPDLVTQVEIAPGTRVRATWSTDAVWADAPVFASTCGGNSVGSSWYNDDNSPQTALLDLIGTSTSKTRFVLELTSEAVEPLLVGDGCADAAAVTPYATGVWVLGADLSAAADDVGRAAGGACGGDPGLGPDWTIPVVLQPGQTLQAQQTGAHRVDLVTDCNAPATSCLGGAQGGSPFSYVHTGVDPLVGWLLVDNFGLGGATMVDLSIE